MNANALIFAVALVALIAGVITKSGVLTPMGTLGGTPEKLTDTRLLDVANRPHQISEWQGKIRVINFWATWCPPCRKEIPELIALQKNFNNRGVVVIGIAIDELSAVAKYQSENGINYPLLIANDNGMELAKSWGDLVGAVPFTLVVNQQDEIIFKHAGAVDLQMLESIIQPLIN
jgi:Thiol-disulfide isomerase and thioredoxins